DYPARGYRGPHDGPHGPSSCPATMHPRRRTMLAFNEAATLTLDIDDIDDEQTEFTFDQLDDRAKDHARDQHRDINVDHDWWDSTYEDAITIAEMLNISIRTRTVKLYGGGTRQEPQIMF